MKLFHNYIDIKKYISVWHFLWYSISIFCLRNGTRIINSCKRKKLQEVSRTNQPSSLVWFLLRPHRHQRRPLPFHIVPNSPWRSLSLGNGQRSRIFSKTLSCNPSCQTWTHWCESVCRSEMHQWGHALKENVKLIILKGSIEAWNILHNRVKASKTRLLCEQEETYSSIHMQSAWYHMCRLQKENE